MKGMAATKKSLVKGIEFHLYRYRHYKVAIRNLQKQLDFIMPNMTSSYELLEGSTGTFRVESSTEKAAIDRIESRKALNIHEEMQRYDLILNCIEEAVAGLDKTEQHFVDRRYFQGVPVTKIAETDGYSVPQMYKTRDQILDKLLISLSSIVNF